MVGPSEKEIKREIKVLELFHNFYDFEQNHTLNDWMPRMILGHTTGLAIAIAFMHFGYWYFALFIYLIAIFDSYKQCKELNRTRKRMQNKKQQIRTNILRRYKLLGVNVDKFVNEFEQWEVNQNPINPQAI